MANNIEFKDFSLQVKEEINDKIIAGLYEVSGELAALTKRNSRRPQGQTAGSFRYIVHESEKEAVIGSDKENSIWEEYGTGEYALSGDGRQGGWVYKDDEGFHFTKGKTPTRAFFKAYTTLKPKIIKYFQQIFKGD